MRRTVGLALLTLSAMFALGGVARADCTYHVIARFHYQAADGGDRACVVFQSNDCTITTMCAG